MIRLLLAAIAGSGIALLLLERGATRTRSAPLRIRSLRSFGPVAVGGALAASATWLAVGGTVPVVVAGLLGSVAPSRLRRRELERRADRLADAWPRLLDEARVLCGPGGQSLPQAVFQAGTRADRDLRSTMDEAEHTYRLTGDFDAALESVRSRLTDPTTHLVCSTLSAVHGSAGGTQHDQLGRLADDRRRDASTRRNAQAQLAGARFARRFVVLVPPGMAVAGQAVGTGRSAFTTATGQAAAVVALVVVAGCWAWSGRLLVVPLPGRATR
ncbi:MAG: type II secretion system F family protein [Actinomycetota bacterium]